MVDGNKLWTNHMLCPNIMENPYSKEILLAHIHYYFIPGAFRCISCWSNWNFCKPTTEHLRDLSSTMEFCNDQIRSSPILTDHNLECIPFFIKSVGLWYIYLYIQWICITSVPFSPHPSYANFLRLSMALDRPVKKDLAMSGEVTPGHGCGHDGQWLQSTYPNLTYQPQQPGYQSPPGRDPNHPTFVSATSWLHPTCGSWCLSNLQTDMSIFLLARIDGFLREFLHLKR